MQPLDCSNSSYPFKLILVPKVIWVACSMYFAINESWRFVEVEETNWGVVDVRSGRFRGVARYRFETCPPLVQNQGKGFVCGGDTWVMRWWWCKQVVEG